MKNLPAGQRGAALIVSLIMLALITLFAVSSFRLGKMDLQIAGNMEQRNQAFSAAQSAIETAISSAQFTVTPANALANPCGGVPNTTCMDVNGDGVADVNVLVTPACDAIVPILNAQLNLANANDAGCLLGAGQDFGISGAANNNSMCANSVWDLTGAATDNVTSARYVVHQGVAVRVPPTAACP